MKKYEASFYILRVEPPDPESENYKRLHDIYFRMPDINEAFKYAKDDIRNPTNEAWETVLFKNAVPYASLQWDKIHVEDPNSDVPFYRCDSKPFIGRKTTTKWIIRIRIFPETKETGPPGVY